MHSELGNALSHAQSVYTWSMWHKFTMRLVQIMMIIFINTFVVNVNILLYAEILNGLIFDSAYIEARYTLLSIMDS